MTDSTPVADRPDHIVTFDETAYRSVSLLPREAAQVSSVDDIESEEYKTIESAECTCGEHFDTHEEALAHLHSVAAEAEQ